MQLYSPLIAWTTQGLFCQSGGFHIDPHRAVETAVITHAHSDHARRGSKLYICEESGVELLQSRLGKKIQVQSFRYGEEFKLGDVWVSFHSAGHILGSAQVKVRRGSEVWVASGDYKRDRDPSCRPFESVPCDVFITEATFGTPSFVWPKELEHGRLIYEWWQENAARGFNSVLFGYSLGKAQRILAELAELAPRSILIHNSIAELTECYRRQGVRLASTEDLQYTIQQYGSLEGELILCPPSVLKESWAPKLGRYKTAFASGWMNGSGQGFRRGGYDHGFVMSDHADWDDLNRTIRETGAQRIFVQHRNGALIQHLKKSGLEAFPIEELTPEKYFALGQTNLSLL